MHSFVHPRVAKLMGMKPFQGALLTVTIANGNKVLQRDVFDMDSTFLTEGRDHQVVVHSPLYVLEGLQNDVVLGMDFHFMDYHFHF